eukprot:gene6261-6499_t
MAIHRVVKDMEHLDHVLSSDIGRQLLQQLPSDALAALLSSDRLAVASENSVIAAIDVWLSGPLPWICWALKELPDLKLIQQYYREELEHLVNQDGGRQQQLAFSYLPCLLHWNSAAGAAQGLVPIDIQDIVKGTNVLSAAGISCCGRREKGLVDFAEAPGEAQVVDEPQQATAAAATASAAAGMCLQGWQPALWSGLAPGGALYWYAGLRQLLD